MIFVFVSCTPVTRTPVSAPDAGPTYGIYWFGKNDANQFAISGQPSPYYDPTKPTILFVHGWQPDQAYTHRTMLWEFENVETAEEEVLDLAAPWIDAGWNLGVFDWGPFADEEIVLDAEAKIWTADGKKGMRWRDHAGDYQAGQLTNASVGELFYDAYIQALADFSGPELRLAGHSLGNQLAASLLAQLAEGINRGDLSDKLMPQRLALLDPYWSPLARDYLGGEKTGDRVRAIIKLTTLSRDIPVEWYHSSSLTDGFLISDANETMQYEVVYTKMRPRYCKLTDQVCKHEAAWQSYFLSRRSPPPPECERSAPGAPCLATGRSAPSASTSNERLAEMLTEPYHWLQVTAADGNDSTMTRQTDDDLFERRLSQRLQ
ncbi:MAG: hypothetical protein GY759_21060 [Chloroflexi bacterium]|nr:hypothetical protein [Chloroflexota bacterium]